MAPAVSKLLLTGAAGPPRGAGLTKSLARCKRRNADLTSATDSTNAFCVGQIFPWQCLYFFPEPHGHGSLRPTFSPARVNGGATATSPSAAAAASASS